MACIISRQGRLFPPAHAAQVFSADEIARLGALRIPGRDRGQQGHTYLGQFIAHELAGRAPRDGKPAILRSPRLELESLYGFGWNGCGFDERAGLDRHGRFAIAAEAVDLPRDAVGRARIADFRNDQNLILAQLHLLFQKFHNAVLARISDSSAFGSLALGERFSIARQFVTWTLQEIVLGEYLRGVISPTVYAELLRWSPVAVGATEASVPLEFSMATFRFGHAMVRAEYRINARHLHLPLESLLYLSGDGGLRPQPSAPANATLPVEYAVDMRLFFATDRGVAGPAQPIGFDLAAGMGRLPFVTPDSVLLRNLQAGAQHAIPSGQEVAAALKRALRRVGRDPDHYRILGRLEDFALDAETVRVLRDLGVYARTPLWMFVLIEACRHPAGSGATLGPVGSLINFGVVKSSVELQRQHPAVISRPRLEQVAELTDVDSRMGDIISLVRKNAECPTMPA